MKNGPYELIEAPDEYPGKKYRDRYAYEHHVVWWQNTGEIRRADQILHHKNGHKRDNRFENLEILDRDAHSRMHALEQGTLMAVILCPFCNDVFEKPYNKTVYGKGTNGGKLSFCSRSCSAKYYGNTGAVDIEDVRKSSLLDTYTDYDPE